jgi:hypothetical protein
MPTPARAERIEQALRAALDASFACGEWSDDSSEPWDRVFARSEKAAARLRKILHIDKVEAPCPDCAGYGRFDNPGDILGTEMCMGCQGTGKA